MTTPSSSASSSASSANNSTHLENTMTINSTVASVLDNNNTSLELLLDSINFAEVAKTTSQNGNPFNLIKNGIIKQSSIWGKELVQSKEQALTLLFGQSVAQHMMLHNISLPLAETFQQGLLVNQPRWSESAINGFLINWAKLVMCSPHKGEEAGYPVWFVSPIKPEQEFVTLGAEVDTKMLTTPPNIAGLNILGYEYDGIGKCVNHTIGSFTLDLMVQSMAVDLRCRPTYGEVRKALQVKAKRTNRYTYEAVQTAYNTHYCNLHTGNQYTFLVDIHVYNCMELLFGEVPSNVVSVGDWLKWYDSKLSKEALVSFFDGLAKSMVKTLDDKTFLSITVNKDKNEYYLTFEDAFSLIINDEGIFEADRMRQLYNNIIVRPQAATYIQGEVPEEDLTLLSAHNVLVRYVVQHSYAFVSNSPFMASFYSKKLAVDLPFVALEDCGVMDGDRQAVVGSTCPTKYGHEFVRTWKYQDNEGHWVTGKDLNQSELPFFFGNVLIENGEWVNKLHIRKYNYTEQKANKLGSRIRSYQIDKAAFHKYNLVRSKDHFIDGRRVCLQAKHIKADNDMNLVIVAAMCMKAYHASDIGSVVKAIYKQFPHLEEAAWSNTELFAFLAKEMTFGLSSKLSKLVKRAVMYAAQIGEVAGSEGRGIKFWGQKAESINCLPVASIISPFHNLSPGMALNFNHQMFDVTVPSTITRTISVLPVRENTKDDRTVVLDMSSIGECEVGYTKYGKNVWKQYKLKTPVRRDVGDTLCVLPYLPTGLQGAVDHMVITNDIPDVELTAVLVKYGKKAGKVKMVDIKIEVQHHEQNIKIRGINKAMCGTGDHTIVFNKLNRGAKIKADLLLPRDVNKWQDTLHGFLDVIYLTAKKGNWDEGKALIEGINTTLERPFEWSPIADMLGIYQPLREAFEEKFGRSLWVESREVGVAKDKSALSFERQMFEKTFDWKVVNNVPAGLRNATDNLENFVCYAQVKADSKFIDWADLPKEEMFKEKTNLVIFSWNDKVEYKAQRSWVYVGTTDCPVYVPIKAEMTSVRSSVGTSKMMAGMAREVANTDPLFAAKIMQANYRDYDKFAAFIGMSRSSNFVDRNTGKQLKTVVLNPNPHGFMPADVRGMLTNDETKALISSTRDKGNFLPELAKHFKDVVFVIKTNEIVKEVADDEDEVGVEEYGSFSIWLPAIVAQDANLAYRVTDSMSSNIEILFKRLIFGSDWKVFNYNTDTVMDNLDIVTLCNRIRGAIRGLVKTQGIAKCAAFGYTGVVGKTTAIYGVPMDEVWVRKSTRKNSAYQTIKRAFKLSASEMNGYPVLFGRAPMTATGKVKLRVIDSMSEYFYQVNEDTYTMNPLACYLHRGDNDGDLNYFYPGIINKLECKLNYLDSNLLINSVKMTTGKDHLILGGSYYSDGFEIPTYASYNKKREFSSKFISLNCNEADMLNPEQEGGQAPSLPQLLSGSTRMIKEAVGIIHRLFITYDWYCMAIQEQVRLTCSVVPENLSWVNIKLIQILAEIYEVPLGGFDTWAYVVFYKYLIPLITNEGELVNDVERKMSGNFFNEEGFVCDPNTTLPGAMNAANMNGSVTIDTKTGEEIENIPEQIIKAIDAHGLAVSWTRGIAKIANKPFKEWTTALGGTDAYEAFFSLVAEIGVLLSKGLFHPVLFNSGSQESKYSRHILSIDQCWDLGIDYAQYIAQLEAEDEQEVEVDTTNNVSAHRMFVNAFLNGCDALGITTENSADSVIYGPIFRYINTVGEALIGDTVKIDFNFFIDSEKEQEEVETVEVTVETVDYTEEVQETMFLQWLEGQQQ